MGADVTDGFRGRSSGTASSGTASSGSSGGTSASAASCSNASIQHELYAKGALTVATDKPAYPPWFENNNPVNCIS